MPNVVLTDATCYETSMRFIPHKLNCSGRPASGFTQIKKINKLRKGRMPRSKYAEQKSKYLAFQKTKKKPYKKIQKRIKSLLYLLEKLIGQIEAMQSTLPDHIALPAHYKNRIGIFKKVLEQQKSWYETGEKPADLIVSIDKSYIRPIVRGKDTKRVKLKPVEKCFFQKFFFIKLK